LGAVMGSFRSDAFSALGRARQLLNEGEEQSLIYAALELRFTLEYLTYDRALAYTNELPEAVHSVWQPKNLMKVLLEIDPFADAEMTLSIGIAPSKSEGSSDLQTLGTERPLTLSVIKHHYDALGSFLHAPDLRRGKRHISDHEKLRERCNKLVDEIERVLSADLWNLRSTAGYKFQCPRCDTTRLVRLKSSEESLDFQCLRCNAEFRGRKSDINSLRYNPKGKQFRCTNQECGNLVFVWSDELRAEAMIECGSCGTKHTIGLSVFGPEKDEKKHCPGSSPG
jgi:predicted RNA-binding Zn-ribbon protein involved in translation (DUF1610 family)